MEQHVDSTGSIHYHREKRVVKVYDLVAANAERVFAANNGMSDAVERGLRLYRATGSVSDIIVDADLNVLSDIIPLAVLSGAGVKEIEVQVK